MEKLIKILEKFDTLRDYFLNKEIKWDEAVVVECFKPCAEEILCGGYFLVNGKYIIDLGCIELYYHEEGDTGKIKDPIMYHTNDKVPYSIYYKEIGEYPYFKMGSFNLHQSGVDVTFENPDKKYRASFLIRSYRVFEIKEHEKKENIEKKLINSFDPQFDSHSTHIFDDMFPKGIIVDENKEVSIEWISYSKGGGIEPCKRIHVAEYKKQDGKYIKNEKSEYVKIEIIDKKSVCKDSYFKSGDRYYQNEERNWGFKRIGIREYK